MTSGAIQYGVPTNVLRRDMVVSSCADTPKSAGVGDRRSTGVGKGKGKGCEPEKTRMGERAYGKPHTNLDVALVVHKDVAALDVAVKAAQVVEVHEALHTGNSHGEGGAQWAM